MIKIEGEGAAFTVPAEIIADGLKLAPAAVPDLLQSRAITTACEAGTEEDAGTWRLTFAGSHRRLRLIIDASGAIIGQSVLDFGGLPLPPGARKPGAV